MNHGDIPAYGLRSLAVINSFAPPENALDWRSFGAFSAFLVALSAKMYGFALTIYLLSGWLTSLLPRIDWYAHDSGHLLEMWIGWRGNPHLGPFYILSQVLILGGFILTASAWTVLFSAQKAHRLATTGPYTRVRHPRHVGFALVMTGFLLQWPTIATIIMCPILIVMYRRLARREERDALVEFGAAYQQYATEVPAFIPRLGKARRGPSLDEHRWPQVH